MGINDSSEREALAREAQKEGWSRERLRAEIAKRHPRRTLPPETLEARPGKIGTYRIVKAKAGEFKDKFVLDLGFSNYLSLGEFSPRRWAFHDRDIVTLEKRKLKKAGIEEDLFTYKAEVFRVIDGDTLYAVVSLGFGFNTVQKLRLRGLDAPEIQTSEGQEAKAFVEKILKKTGGSILIKTKKSDKYDRYLADVWVGDTCLNQKLIDADLAVRVSE